MTSSDRSANRVRLARIDAGLTQSQLADLAGVSRTAITAIEADRAMQEAILDGVRLNTSEAPARDLALRAAEAAAIRARDENIRRQNKATFKP